MNGASSLIAVGPSEGLRDLPKSRASSPVTISNQGWYTADAQVAADMDVRLIVGTAVCRVPIRLIGAWDKGSVMAESRWPVVMTAGLPSGGNA